MKKNKHAVPTALKGLAAAVMLAGAANASADMTIAEMDDGTKLMMFGILDTGFLYQSKASIGGDSNVQMESNGMRQSVIGWKGTRPMFNGWTVFFNLEAHFNLDSGMFHTTEDDLRNDNSTGPFSNLPDQRDDESGRLLFRRQANLGISGDFGTIILGRQYGPALLAHLATEPRIFKENFSNLYGWAYSQLFTSIGQNDGTANAIFGTNGRNSNNDVGIFMKNAIQYRNNFKGLDFGVLYSLGGVEGNMGNNNIWAVGASYSTGPVTFTGSYEVFNDELTGREVIEHWGAGAAVNLGFVDMGDVNLKINYMQSTNHDGQTGQEILKMDGLGLGADWAWNEKNFATIAYYINQDDCNWGSAVNGNACGTGAGTDSFVLSNEYTIAPKTVIYSVVSVVDVDQSAGTIANFATSIVANPAPVGETTTFVNVGVNYQF